MAGTNNALNNSATVFQVDNLNLDGNTISSTNSSGSIQLTPASGGNVQATVAGGGAVQAIGSTAGTATLLESLNTDNSNTSSDAYIRARTGGASGGSPYLGVNNSAGNSFSWGIAGTSPTLLKESVGSPGGTLLRQMTVGGQQTLPLQCGFLGYVGTNVTNATGDSTYYTLGANTLTKAFDKGTNLNTNGTFTAPVAGLYLFIASVGVTNLSAGHNDIETQFQINGSTISNTQSLNPFVCQTPAFGQFIGQVQQLFNLAAGDTVICRTGVFSSTKTVTIIAGANLTYFSGVLLG